MRIVCRTNLDLEKCAEKWPEDLPEVPRVGDYIESSRIWCHWPDEESRSKGGIPPCKSVLELQVCGVRWRCHQPIDNGGSWPGVPTWYAEVELHLPQHRFENIRHFYQWYGKITGKGMHAYI